jgi:tight adherence protein C
VIDFIFRTANDPTTLAGLLLAAALFATVVTLAAPMLQSDKLVQRMKLVNQRRETLRRNHRAQSQQSGLRRSDDGIIRQIVEKYGLQKLLLDDKLESKLAQAGMRGPKPISMFYFFRGALPLGLGLAAWTYVGFMGAKIPPNFQLLIVMGAAAFGFYAPSLYLSNIITKRKTSIMSAFPDALDMLLICVESGMSIEVALQRVSAEIGTASIELAEELSLTTAELSYLPDRRLAYENLAKRTDHPGVKAVAMALVQAEKYGTPLGTALRTMAKENRELRMLQAEKKAAALPAQLTVPMIAFFLPVLCAVIIAPAMIQVSETLSKNPSAIGGP